MLKAATDYNETHNLKIPSSKAWLAIAMTASPAPHPPTANDLLAPS